MFFLCLCVRIEFVLFFSTDDWLSVGWTCKVASQHLPTPQLDAGEGKVVMTDELSSAFFLSGSTWYKLGSVPLKHVSVGPAGLWGVDPLNRVYKYVAGDFISFDGDYY